MAKHSPYSVLFFFFFFLFFFLSFYRLHPDPPTPTTPTHLAPFVCLNVTEFQRLYDYARPVHLRVINPLSNHAQNQHAQQWIDSGMMMVMASHSPSLCNALTTNLVISVLIFCSTHPLKKLFGLGRFSMGKSAAREPLHPAENALDCIDEGKGFNSRT